MKKHPFSLRHWLIILFGFFLYYFYTAAVPDGMNVILPQLAAENQFEYEILLSLTTVAGIISVVAVALLGKLCVVLGARKMIFISIIGAAIFFYLYGHSSSLPMFLISLCGVISCANSFAFIGCGALVSNWFPTKKGIASGYTAIGAPASSMTSVAIYTACFATFGFKPTMTIIAAIMAVFAVICLIFLRDTPEECGEYPDAIPPEERTADELQQIQSEGGPTLSTVRLLKTPQVWLIAVFIGLYSMVMMGVLAQFVVRHNELPIPEAQVIIMFTITSAIGLAGGPIWGRLDARFGTKKAFIICCTSMIIGMTLNFTCILPLVYISLPLFGLGATGTHVYLTAWIVTVFGRRNSSAAYSVIYPIHCVINYLCYVVMAIARILFGEMRFAYLFYIASLILAICLSLLTAKMQKTRPVS